MGVVRLGAVVGLLLAFGAGSAAADATAPGAPTLQTATATGNGVSLTWSAPASDGGSPLTGFRVYRATGNGAATLLASLKLVDSYTDATTVAGTTYSYEVTAVNAIGEGPVSNTLSAQATGPNTASLFQPYQAYPVGSWPDSVAIGDVTGDGRNDIVLTTTSNFDPANDYHVFVFAQSADHTLLPPVSYALGASGPRTSVAVGDVTGDGRNDVVVGIAGRGIDVFPQLAGGTLGAPSFSASTDADKIRLGHLNGDSSLDVAGVGWGTNTVTVLLGNGQGGFLPPTSYAAQHAGYEDLEVGDVTGDGRDDIVVMSGQGLVPNVSVLPQLAGGGFAAAAAYTVTSGTTQGIGIGDVTGDGRNDVVVSYGGNQPNASIAVLPQTGSGTLGAPVRRPSYDIPEPVEVADVDLDGRADVVTLHGGWLRAGVYRQQAGGTLAAEDLYAIPDASHYNPHGLAVGDIDGNGSPDIVLADYNNGLVVLRSTLRTSVPSSPLLTDASPGNASVSLTWSAPSSNGGAPVTGYRIYRGTAAGSETLLATVGNVNAYADTAVANGTTYYYAITAVNATGESALSNELSATPATVPGAPVLISAKGGGGIALTWRAPVSNGGAPVTGYRIYRGSGSGRETLLATVGNVTSYADTTAPNGKTAYYQVSAVNRVGEGARSNELSAKPKR